MRTTLEIRDDVLKRVKEYAAARSISNGAAVSEVLERGLEAEIPIVWKNGIPVFSPGPGAKRITPEQALSMKDAIEDEL